MERNMKIQKMWFSNGNSRGLLLEIANSFAIPTKKTKSELYVINIEPEVPPKRYKQSLEPSLITDARKFLEETALANAENSHKTT